LKLVRLLVRLRRPFGRASQTLLALSGSLLLLAGCSSSADRAARARDEGETLASRGQYIEARARFDTAVALRDDQPELWIARARNQVALSDYAGAFGSYTSALDLDRTNREALNAVGQIALLADKTEQAERIADQILALAPDDLAALYVKGSVQLQGRRFESAGRTIEQGLKINPKEENLLVLQSRLLADRGDFTQAASVLRPAFDAKSTNPLVLGQLADVYDRQFKGREALLVRAQAARASPNDAATLYAFGKQLLARGMIGDGINMVRLSIARQKKPADDRSVLLALAESDVDADALAKVFSTQSTIDQATRIAGARYALLAERPQAARAILFQVPVNERDQKWSALCAYFLARGGSSAAAVDIAENVLKADGRTNFALAARALVTGQGGRLDDALRDARVAASDAPREPEHMSVLATVLALRGDGEAARATYFEGFNRNRDNVMFLRALVRSRQGTQMTDLVPLVRDFTIRNPANRAAWGVRKSVCLAVRDMACAARSAAIIRSLAAENIVVPPAPPEEVPGPNDG
jgi:tetratricopeptide (TPR) repeat protein